MHGPTVSALSSLALPYVPTNSFFLHTKTPTHRNSSPFPNQAYLFTLHPLCLTTPTEPLHTSSPLPNHADRAPTSSNPHHPQLRLTNTMAKFWAWVLFFPFFFLLFLSFSHWVSGFGCIFFLYFSISFPISVLHLGSESNFDGESFQQESHQCDFRRVLQRRRWMTRLADGLRVGLPATKIWSWIPRRNLHQAQNNHTRRNLGVFE